MKKTIIIIGLLLTVFLQAQNNMEILWQGCYGGSENDIAYDIVTIYNGFLVFGETRSNDGNVSNNHGDRDIWIVSIDSVGNILWEKSYGGSEPETPNNIIKINDNEYYFGAWTASNDGDIQSGNHGGYDRWIVKINGDGDIIWEKCYGGSMTEYGGQLKLLSNGNILTYGATSSSDGDVPVNYGSLDVWLMIITPDGEILKSEVFGYLGHNNVFDIVETNDDGFFMASKTIMTGGMIQGEFHGETDVWAVKLDSSLNIQWQKLYGGSYTDYGHRGVLELEDGYLFLAQTNSNDGDVSGCHGSGLDVPRDIWVVRIDSIGNIIWQNCLGGYSWESSGTLHQAEDGGFIIFGETDSNNGDVSGNNSWQGNSDIWMVKISAEGELEWQECYGGYGNERIYSGVIRKSETNWVIAGRTDNNSYDVDCNLHGLEDYWVFEIKDTSTNIINTSTKEQGIKVYPNPARDYVVFELPATANHNAVIPTTGGRRNPPKGTTAGNSGDSSPAKAGFGMTTLDGSAVVIVNVFGQEVLRLPVKTEKTYPHSASLWRTTWDCRQTENGIYFYSLKIDGKHYSGKVVVQK